MAGLIISVSQTHGARIYRTMTPTIHIYGIGMHKIRTVMVIVMAVLEITIYGMIE